MFRLELSEESLNPHPRDISNSNNKLKEKQVKHLNAIRPYVKERKNSNSKRDHKNQHLSPHQVKSKSKKSQTNSRRIDETNNPKQLGQIYHELVSLKAQYKALKSSYNNLVKQKNQLTAREMQELAHHQEVLKDLEKSKKQTEKYKHNLNFMEQEIQRIRKECFKLLEGEKFKNKKLQETIQEKQLMISYLRSQLPENPQTQQSFQNRFFFQHTAPAFNYDPSRISINQSAISNLPDLDFPKQVPRVNQECQQKKHQRLHTHSIQEDSLSFSKDRSKDFESVLSYNEPAVLSFTKKDIVVLQDEKEKQQDLLTFENRMHENFDPNQHQMKAQTKKNKLNSKRLQICTDDTNEGKDNSAEVKKRKIKKKQTKKRKSEDINSNLIKK